MLKAVRLTSRGSLRRSDKARLRSGEHGLVRESEGWFVVNARAVRWRASEKRAPITNFEGEVPFSELGINLTVIESERLAALYHAEDAQEDFLVVSGECLLLIEDQQR